MATDTIITYARERFDHESAKRVMREKYLAKMIFAHAGGLWKAGPELQATLISCPNGETILLDLYDTPVRVDKQELLALSHQRWQEQMTAWLIDYTEMQQQR